MCMLRKTLIVLLLVVCVRYAEASERVIQIENQTYSPLHYRVRTSRGFSEWSCVLPGAAVQFTDGVNTSVEVWKDKDSGSEYALQVGKSYVYYRNAPHAPPTFEAWDGPRLAVPTPPGAPRDATSPRTAFSPLESFVARCGERNHSYRLSLKKLADDCDQAQRHGPLPAELRYLRGFTWFFGYIVDDQNKDVILLGVQDPTRPPLDIDCLATAIKAASSSVAPYCSLEEHSDPKLSKSIVAGVPWKSRFAEVMIQADYEMGRLCGGHWQPSIPGFKSQHDYFADVLSTQGRALEFRDKNGPQWNRWWYNADSTVPRAVADASGKLLYLYRNPVRLSTEMKVNDAYGSGITSPSARMFAEGFTRHMDALGQEYPSIAELQAMFRLYDLMRHLHVVGKTEAPAGNYWDSAYVSHFEGPPDAMPAMSNPPTSRVITERIDVPRPEAGTSFSGTETLSGYNRLTFHLHNHGRATMVDAKETTQGRWEYSGNQITLRFYSGSVVYVGTWYGSSMSGGASNGKSTWTWYLDTGFETRTWTWGKR